MLYLHFLPLTIKLTVTISVNIPVQLKYSYNVVCLLCLRLATHERKQIQCLEASTTKHESESEPSSAWRHTTKHELQSSQRVNHQVK